MQRKLLATLSLLLLVGAAPALIQTEELWNDASGVASGFGLTYRLPEGGIASYWPEEVESVAELAPLIARVRDPARLNEALGEGADLGKGDLVVLRANDAGGGQLGFRGTFYSLAGTWTCPDLDERLERLGGPSHFFDVWVEVGIGGLFKSTTLPHRDGMCYLARVDDPAAFKKSFAGEGEIAEGAVGVVMMQAESMAQNMQFLQLQGKMQGDSRRFIVNAGKVEVR